MKLEYQNLLQIIFVYFLKLHFYYKLYVHLCLWKLVIFRLMYNNLFYVNINFILLINIFKIYFKLRYLLLNLLINHINRLIDFK